MKKIFMTSVLVMVLALFAAGDVWPQGKSGKEKKPKTAKGQSGAVSNPGKAKGKQKNKAGAEDAVETQADVAEKNQEAKSEDAEAAKAVEGQGQTAAEASNDEAAEVLEKKLTGQQMVVRQIDKNIEKEEAKHYERVAKLERVREVMEKMDNEEGAREAEQILAKENERHQRVMKLLTKERSKAQAKLDRTRMEAEMVGRMSGGGGGQ